MSQPIKPEWRNTDPRYDFIDMKRVDIVILRPNIKGNGTWEAGIGYAEMKHGYCVITSFDNHKVVSEEGDWDPAWLWIETPRKEE